MQLRRRVGVRVRLNLRLLLATAPEHTNSVFALVSGGLIARVIVFDAIRVMRHLDHNMIPRSELIE